MKFDVAGPLDRARLRRILDRAGVSQASYNLEGSHEPEAFVLSHRAGGWATFYSERGCEVDRREFDNEDAACFDLLNRLFPDPTTQ